MAYMKCPKCGTVGLMRDVVYPRKRDGANCKAIVFHQKGCGYSKLLLAEHPTSIVLSRKGQYEYQF